MGGADAHKEKGASSPFAEDQEMNVITQGHPSPQEIEPQVNANGRLNLKDEDFWLRTIAYLKG